MPEKAVSQTFNSLQEPRQRQYVIIHHSVPSKQVQRVEYSSTVIETVKGLTIAQLSFGVIIFVFHIVVTAIGDRFYNQLDLLKNEIGDPTFHLDTVFPDHTGTGVWVGLLAAVTAGIGFGAYKKQTKGIIVLHLMLNVALLAGTFILTTTLSVNIHRISTCKSKGLKYNSNLWSALINSTTAGHDVYLLLDEEINLLEGTGLFYCQKALFKTWIGLDAFLVLCSVIEFFIMLALLLYNSAAVCFCCRRTGCCGKCCTCCYETAEEGEGQMVSYCTETCEASVIPSVPMASLDAVAGIIVPSSAMPPYAIHNSALALSSHSQLAKLDAMFTNMSASEHKAVNT